MTWVTSFFMFSIFYALFIPMHYLNIILNLICFVNSGNTMNKSFQRTDTVFRIDQVNIVTKNILELDIQRR